MSLAWSTQHRVSENVLFGRNAISPILLSLMTSSCDDITFPQHRVSENVLFEKKKISPFWASQHSGQWFGKSTVWQNENQPLLCSSLTSLCDVITVLNSSSFHAAPYCTSHSNISHQSYRSYDIPNPIHRNLACASSLHCRRLSITRFNIQLIMPLKPSVYLCIIFVSIVVLVLPATSLFHYNVSKKPIPPPSPPLSTHPTAVQSSFHPVTK